MTKAHSSGASTPSKPPKPYPDFPLFAHATGRWAKKIRGRLVYFGKWDDPEGALQRYLDHKDALHAGRNPDEAEGPTVFSLCGRFLTAKKNRLDSGELSIHSFNEYTATCKRLLKAFGRNRLVSALRPDDFERLRVQIAKRWGPVRLGNEIMRVRSVFKFVLDLGQPPVVFGEGFRRPSKKTLRKHREERGPKMFEAAEIKRMLAAAGQPLKAMILLGINCGFGNSDIGTLPLAALDVERGWLSYPRPKTGIARKCPLWPETIKALMEWLAVRPMPKKPEHIGLVFLTATGDSWAKQTMDDPISKETSAASA
jgi:site-specific recombinase XerC